MHDAAMVSELINSLMKMLAARSIANFFRHASGWKFSGIVAVRKGLTMRFDHQRDCLIYWCCSGEVGSHQFSDVTHLLLLLLYTLLNAAHVI